MDLWARPAVILPPFGLSYQPNRLQQFVGGKTGAHLYGVSALVDTGADGPGIRQWGVHTIVQPLPERALPGDPVPDGGLDDAARRLVSERWGLNAETATFQNTRTETGGRLITGRPEDLSMGRFEQHEHHLISAAERWEKTLKSGLTDQNLETAARRIAPFLGGAMKRDNFELTAPSGPTDLQTHLDQLHRQVGEELRVGPSHGRATDWLTQGECVPAQVPQGHTENVQRWRETRSAGEARGTLDRTGSGRGESR
ncbi:MAG: hypothetical protein GEV07_28145 [Streptosporangiales bacterium]|nr:hypothetical protein [Streptosporangiales bacterium]